MKPRVALREFDHKTRVFIVSDISNEPDDAESLVRYLLYANEFDTRGLVACTSTWMKRVVHPEDMEKIVRAYAKVVENLNSHVSPKNPYPSAQEILQLVKAGPSVYGKEALDSGIALSDGAKLLIERLDESDMSLWVLCWGGTNVIAQALQHVHLSRSAAECAKFRSKIRIYAISDQDDTGMWIRVTYPDIFYICSVHAWNQYGLAAWTGISGDKYYGFDKGGPDITKVTKDWIAQNIQVGPLGSAYPDYMFIPEGDTPTFLYLVPNGLGSPENPSWGSWGGRYGATDPGQAGKHYSDLVDCVTGEDGQQHISNQATIWRWRDAFQNDFAARMQWTLTSDFSKANHHPVAIVNGHSVPGEALYINAEAGSEIVLDASDSYDPDDGDALSFRWFHYKEVTATQWSVQLEVADVEIKPVDTESKIVKCVLPPPEKCAVDLFTRQPLKLGQVMHLILELKDGGNGTKNRLSTYKRVVVQITNYELRGGGRQAVENIASVTW